MLYLFRTLNQKVFLLKGQIEVRIAAVSTAERSVTLSIRCLGREQHKTLKTRESTLVIPEVQLKLLEVLDDNSVRLGIQAPRDIDITRDDYRKKP